MNISFSRRRLLQVAALGASAVAVARAAPAAPRGDFAARIAELEAREGGRLGVALFNGGAVQGHRLGERFAMCSTFKFVASALILERVQAGEERLDRAIDIRQGDMVSHAPVTQHAVGRSMTIGELCRAAMVTSDNPAANLLVMASGGPKAVTAFARRHGDDDTRLDRLEPEMNLSGGGEERDTTTPEAMARLVDRLVLRDALRPEAREILTGWLGSCRTGETRLRAGMPAEWSVGDKTGAGEGITNDVAVVWPHKRPPFVVAAYYERKGRTPKENAPVLAEVGRIVAGAV